MASTSHNPAADKCVETSAGRRVGVDHSVDRGARQTAPKGERVRRLERETEEEELKAERHDGQLGLSGGRRWGSGRSGHLRECGQAHKSARNVGACRLAAELERTATRRPWAGTLTAASDAERRTRVLGNPLRRPALSVAAQTATLGRDRTVEQGQRGAGGCVVVGVKNLDFR